MEKNKGFIALITVLIVSAVVLLLVTSINILGIFESIMGLEESQAAEAFYSAAACAEEALMKLKENVGYLGNEALNIAGGTCQILPVEGNWIIKVIGSYQNMVRKMTITVSQVDPQMVISSWQEVADF